MTNSKTDRFPTRLAALLFADFFCNFMIQVRRKNLDLDYDQILIAFFITSRSMRSLLNSRYEAENYGFEEIILPEDERISVSVKEIASNLEIPRETVRRKLIPLLDRKMIIKKSDGYIFPPQLDDTDITSEFRVFIEESLSAFLKKIDLVYKSR